MVRDGVSERESAGAEEVDKASSGPILHFK